MLDSQRLSSINNSSDEKQEKVAKIVRYDMNIRGAYLAQVIPIEELVKDIISYHFCCYEDKRKQFVSLILNGTYYTFASGINILEKILEIHYPNLSQRYPKLVNDLDKIRRFRNVLVHSTLDTSNEFLAKNYTDRIRLLSYDERGQANYREITRSEIDERIEDCLDIHFVLVDIRVEVRDCVLTEAEQNKINP
jgi:hypothetical protein